MSVSHLSPCVVFWFKPQLDVRAWLTPHGDPDAWRSTELAVGDYVELVAYDNTYVRQGTVVARLDKVEGQTWRGQWAEETFLQVSDEHLTWWLDHRQGKDENWQFEVQAQHACQENRRGRTFDLHTDRFRVLILGDLADKRIECVAQGPRQKFVKEESQRLSGDHQGEPNPDAAPSRSGLAFEDEGAAGHGRGNEVWSKLTELEKQLEQGKAGRKRKTDDAEPAKAEVLMGKVSKPVVASPWAGLAKTSRCVGDDGSDSTSTEGKRDTRPRQKDKKGRRRQRLLIVGPLKWARK